ncbi:MAG: Ig-like domain-containing protein, partial [Bacteroidota bacterium]
MRAQTISDDFSDGDLANPSWSGNTENFVVQDGTLQLMAPGAGTSRLFVNVPESAAASGLSLSFLAVLDFAPSASNFAEFELQSCTGDDCTTAGTIRVGGISGSDDRLSVSLTANGETLELEGVVGAVGSQPATVRFRLVRNADTWTLQTDYSGGTDFQQEASGSLSGFAFNRFEIVCNYTTTRADKFEFDDFLFTAEAPVDETPPTLTTANIVDQQTIELVFSESLEEAVAANVSNYTLSLADVSIDDAVVDGNRVTLSLTGDLPTNTPFDLTIVSVEDLNGNALQD